MNRETSVKAEWHDWQITLLSRLRSPFTFHV